MKLKETLNRNSSIAWAAGILLLLGGVGFLCILSCTAGGLLGGWVARHASPPYIDPTSVPTAVPTSTAESSLSLTPWLTMVPEPEPTPTIPPTPIGGPVPPGEVAEAYASRMTMAVSGAIRPADEIVARASDFNPRPEQGEEYILVELSITCLRQESEVCLYSPLINFKLLGAGVSYEPCIFLMDVPGLLEGGELRGGATVSGALAFVINQDETDLVLVYQNLMGTEWVFLAVPE